MKASPLILFWLAPVLHAQMPSPAALDLKDVVPPVEVFPYPLWMVLAAAFVTMAVLAIVGFLLWRWWKNRPVPPTPTPREIALQELRAARARLGLVGPYEFSILVSEVLRSFLAAEYKLRATSQTSPEFLADASQNPRFSAQQKLLLEQFLGKCDLIKFARADATEKESERLLNEAFDFVEEKA